MPLARLDHVNLCTVQLETMQAFYANVLGLIPGPRPEFSFDGAWLYLGGLATVHLVVVDRARTPGPELTLQHFAFAATDLAALLERLDANAVPYRLGFRFDFGLCQVNLHDPDGNQLHVDFPLAEASALGLAPAAFGSTEP
jgi:catechol 2,3-dioxygenase-like lactoylglutathione lyase family enzyme